jgi:hypothetical protein
MAKITFETLVKGFKFSQMKGNAPLQGEVMAKE